MKRWLISFGAIALVVIGGLVWGRSWLVRQAFAPTPQTAAPGATLKLGVDVEVVAENLTIPWEVAWLPTGEMLATERPGRLLKIGPDRQVIEIAGVAPVGEGGLLGLALHPKFADTHWLYLYFTSQDTKNLHNRVVRYTLEGNHVKDPVTIVDNIPGSQFHDGGRIAFSPDGFLYITTGDAGQSQLAQDTSSLAGKILRVKDDGSILADNPFHNAVYSYGHRNPQGLAWDRDGQLWATEHGRSGAQSGFDEINKIMKGKNYGWPDLEGDETGMGRVAPVLQSGATTTWAPAGAVVINNQLVWAGLRGEALYSADIHGDRLSNLTAHVAGEFGRLRAVALGPDNRLYITTSNQDGRGKPRAGDDKIIRLNPALLLR